MLWNLFSPRCKNLNNKEWHLSTWYSSDHQIFPIDTETFLLSRLLDIYPGLEYICVSCCRYETRECLTLASLSFGYHQVILKGYKNSNLCDIKRQSDLGLVAVLRLEVLGPKSLQSRIHVPCFCLFWFFNTHPTHTKYATAADMKQAVTSNCRHCILQHRFCCYSKKNA